MVDLLVVDLSEVDLQVTVAAQAHPQAVWANLLLGSALENSDRDLTWVAAQVQQAHSQAAWANCHRGLV